MLTLVPDQVIYKYKLISRLGGGHFGQVWIANDQTVDANIALKIIDDPNQTIIQQLEEARIGKRLDHATNPVSLRFGHAAYLAGV